MRVAFLALTNLMIINCVTVKNQFFSQNEADLFIRFIPGVTDFSLITTIRKQKVFRNVFIENSPELNPKFFSHGHWSKISRLFEGVATANYFDYYFSKMVSDTKYDYLLVFCLSNMQQYQGSWFVKHNPKISIQFIEEGSFHYTRPESDLTRPLLLGPYAKNPFYIIKEWLIQTPYLHRLKSKLDGTIYLRMPEAFEYNKKYKSEKLLPFTNIEGGHRFWSTLAENISQEEKIKYELSDFVYLAGYYWDDTTYEKNLEQTIIKTIVSNSHQKVILKTHVGSIAFRNYFSKTFRNNREVYLDTDIYLFEALLYSLKDLDNKVLIARYSSALMNPKLWFDKEPYLIYTHRLYPNWALEKNKVVDDYVEYVRAHYSSPEKVMVPNSMYEFSEMLQECAFRLTTAKDGLDGWSLEDYRKLLEDDEEWTGEENDTMADLEDADSLTTASDQLVEPETEVSKENQSE